MPTHRVPAHATHTTKANVPSHPSDVVFAVARFLTIMTVTAVLTYIIGVALLTSAR